MLLIFFNVKNGSLCVKQNNKIILPMSQGRNKPVSIELSSLNQFHQLLPQPDFHAQPTQPYSSQVQTKMVDE
jgi:hypothetical protein